MELVVALFERGFSEDQVRDALAHCKTLTLDKAVAWLGRRGAGAMRLNSKAETCQICCNDVPAWRAVRLKCSHGWYCAVCMLRHSEARLARGDASVTCPECCTTIDEHDLRKLLPPEVISRLQSRSLDQAVSSASDLWSCPTPNCTMRVAMEDGDVPRLECPLCRKESCLRCGVQPYHKGLTCEEHARQSYAQDKEQQRDMGRLMRWIKKSGTKQCPTCRMAITKHSLENQGTQYSECHKMLCRNCDTRFCFKCLAVLTDDHTCGCSIDRHGFVNPHTGKRVNHLQVRPAAQGSKGGLSVKRPAKPSPGSKRVLSAKPRLAKEKRLTR